MQIIDGASEVMVRLPLHLRTALMLVNPGCNDWYWMSLFGTQIINLIGRMLSVDLSFRLTGQEIASNFPPGVYCEAPLEVYENSNDPPIQHNVELDMARPLGIQDRQAPSPEHVPGPTITV